MNKSTCSNFEKVCSSFMFRAGGRCLLILVFFLGFIAETTLAQPRRISVASGVVGRLADSLAIAQAGDVLSLIDAGPYELDTTLVNTVPVTIQADPGLSVKPKIVMLITNASMFAPRADLTLKGLDLAGINEATHDTTRRFVRIAAPVTPLDDLDIVMRDCWLHDSIADMIRTEVGFGSIILDGILAYDIGDRTMDMRAGTADTLMVTKSTFYRMHDKFRINGTVNAVIFDEVTIAAGFGVNTRAGGIRWMVDVSYTKTERFTSPLRFSLAGQF